MRAFLVVWAIASAAYILFAGQFSPDELLAGAACGLAASLWSSLLRKVGARRLRLERGAWGATLRACAGVPGAAGKVGLKLVQAMAVGASGGIERQTFLHGRTGDPADAGRRAVAVLARSLAPDSFVVRTPEHEDAMVVHALVKTPASDARWAT